MKTARKALPLHEPSFGGREWDYVKECLDSGWVSSAGKFVELFERKAAEWSGASHAVATVNGTSALHLALRVLGVGREDEVIVPSLTFIAAANSVLYQGAVPRFLDVEEETLGLDPRRVAEFLEGKCERRGGVLRSRESGRRIAACMPIHALGHPARVDLIMEACGRFGLPVVEDAAEALGSLYKGKALGSFGRIGVLSFNGNKIVTSGGGGMLLTSDAELASRARHLSTQAKSDPEAFWHDDLGYNYRLPNINAALGLAQMERLEDFVEKKRRVARWYREALDGARGARLLWEPRGARSNFWLNTVRADSPQAAAKLLKRLNENGFAARPLWAPCHRQATLKDCPRGAMTATDALWRTCVNLPSSAGLAREDVEAVARAVSVP